MAIMESMGDHTAPLEDCDACQTMQPAFIEAETMNEAELVWLCPVCGRACPRFNGGDRGAMARASSDRINRTLKATP
jgi:hypothetical protein